MNIGVDETMSIYRGFLIATLFMALAVVALPARADYQGGSFSQAELDRMVGPIALYPDPLLAQVLPASTFADQVQDAAGYVNRSGYRSIDNQDWDISVRALCHYPSVLNMMSRKYDWTTALGQAYLDQPDDVMDAIQRQRHMAYDYGWLRSTSQEEVIVESGGYIRIDPADPTYIYVPTYDSNVVYVRRARNDELSRNIISFGLGFLIGSWLNRDTDWDHHRVYYHGWNGGGWIGRSRSHVTINNIYVNNTYQNQPIQLNRTATRRDITPYRNRLRQNAGRLSPPRAVPTPAPTVTRIPQAQRGHVAGQTWTNPRNTGNRAQTPQPTSVGAGRNSPATSQPQRATRSTGSRHGGGRDNSTVQSDRAPKSSSGANTGSKAKASSDKHAKDAGTSKRGNKHNNGN
jgi:hypothetical protein